MRTLGEVLADLRIANNMKQAEIARTLNVAAPTVSNYEANKYRPDVDKLIMLADYFGVTVDFLLGRHEVNIDMKQIFEGCCKDKISGKEMSLGGIMNLIISLDEDSKSDLIRFVDLLVLRQKAEQSATK